MARYINTADLCNVVMKIKTEYGRLATLIDNIVEGMVMQTPTADVVEREKIEKAIEEIKQTLYVDSLIFGELIDFKNGKITADDVIEEFNRVTRKEVLKILKRNIGESK